MIGSACRSSNSPAAIGSRWKEKPRSNKRCAEESEAREAVMTFVLGLVAEPVPAKFLYDPAPDKLAEIKGRLILEKYNCIGCHQVRSGVYELAKNPALTEKLEDKFKQTIESQSFKGDFHTREFLRATPGPALLHPLPDRLLLYGIPAPLPPDPEPDQMFVRLTQALQFKDSAKQSRDIPAGEVLDISLKDTFALTKPSEPFGGEFPNLIVRSRYLSQVDPQKFQTSANGESPDAPARPCLHPSCAKAKRPNLAGSISS